ncbi:MAG: hypothetical protein R3B57_13305 [Phycisphaerales bacterium]
MPQINKNMFILAIFGSLALQWILAIVSIAMSLSGNQNLAMGALGLSCFAFLLLFLAIAFIAILVYKLWETIQDGNVRTTPGKACGFLFIPLFQLYWIFVAWWGWAVDFNKYTKEKSVSTPPVPEGLAMVMCILAVCSIIPYLGILIGLVNLVPFWMFVTKAIDGANAVRATKPAAPMPTA